jgi:hypothetical protein
MKSALPVVLALALAAGAQAAPNAPQVALGASRIAGVAPLGIHLDARGTHFGAANPRVDLVYRWSVAGREQAKAPGLDQWAATLEPGSYPSSCAYGGRQVRCAEVRVAVEVTEPGGRSASREATVAVYDPSDVLSTVCVSANGSFGACPAGAKKVTSTSFSSAVRSHAGAGVRILLTPGRYSCEQRVGLNFAGPFSIEGVGDTAPTVVSGGKPGNCIELSNGKNPQARDIRIVRLRFESGLQGNARAINLGGRTEDVLVHDVTTQDYPVGLFAFGSPLTFHKGGNPSDLPHRGLILDGLRIRLSKAPRSKGNPLTLFCERCAFINGEVSVGGQGHNTHLARADGLFGAVIARSKFAGPGRSRAAMKVHAGAWNKRVQRGGQGACPDCVGGPYPDKYGPTDGVIFFANEFDCNKTNWCLPVKSQNVSSGERLDRVSFIENTFRNLGRVGIKSAVMRGVAIGNQFEGGKRCIEGGKFGKEWGEQKLEPLVRVGNSC